MNRISLITLLFLLTINAQAQVASVEELDASKLNWFNKDLSADEIFGASVDKAYQELLAGKAPKKVVTVAVIDSGVDIDHDDLAGQLWTNDDEIPGNGIDDDINGYIDDIYGWNFIGNSNGENIYYETMEYTRILRDADHPEYEKAKKLYNEELTKRKKEAENLVKFEKVYYTAKRNIKSITGIDVKNAEDLKEVKSIDPQVLGSKKWLEERYGMGFTEESLFEIKKNSEEYLNYFLNKEFNPRSLVGDDPFDLEDRNYGNPDVKGPRSDHGTAVAGVIAAVRSNGLGIDGIGGNVRIMALRTTPRGDERDKDVALAIMYAVDNGADIINMSFGKPLSPQRDFVDKAIKYAEEKNVLLVHGSGNSGANIDENEFYPSDRYTGGVEATNWINVGATGLHKDKHLPAIFSNYGMKHVDLFAPGVDIISLDSMNTYSMNSGTSLAAPVVSGVAALVLSYYPKLTPQQLIDVLLASVNKVDKPKKVLVPAIGEDRKKITFKELCKSGGVVNAYNALLEAEKMVAKTSSN